MVDEKPIKTTVEELAKLVNVNNYIGNPIETEDKILIPVSKAGVGFGIGESTSERVITGSGAGASVEPVSMVVITKGLSGIEGIRILNLTGGTEVNKALNDIGLIITDIIKEFIPTVMPNGEEYINVDDVNIQDGEIYENAAEDVSEAVEDIVETAEEIKSDAEEVKQAIDDE